MFSALRYRLRRINHIRHALKGACRLRPARGEGAHPQFIVTMASYSERLWQSAPFALASLLKQTEPPDRIIVWIPEGTRLPRALSMMKSYGVEFVECENIGPLTKSCYALRAYPDDILITTDDDIRYPDFWLAALKDAYRAEPTAIHCHRAHEIMMTDDGQVAPYQQWHFGVAEPLYPDRVFPTTGGGVLYPPGSLDGRVLDLALYQELTRKSDDIWLWVMARLKGTPIRVMRDGVKIIDELDNSVPGLWLGNLEAGENDIWLQRCMEVFPEVLEGLRKAPRRP